MTEARSQPTAAQVELFRRCFTGLPKVYGTYDPLTGRVWQMKAPVTDQVIRDHLTGLCPFGVYLLVRDRTNAIAVDFDEPDPVPPRQFVHNAAKRGLPAYIERSKSKGYHVWLFAQSGGILAAKGRYVAKSILRELGLPRVEVFPKQDHLDDGSYGNFINAPLFGRLTASGRSVFIDPQQAMCPFPDQWAFLANIQRISEEQLDACPPTQIPAPTPQQRIPQDHPVPVPTMPPRAYALPPCVREMLAHGVSEGQRVICFRLGVHMKRVGIPQDLAIVMLLAWAKKNHPFDKGILTDLEIIRQVTYAYRKPYWGYGCGDPFVRRHCQSSCPVLRQAEATSTRVPLNSLAHNQSS